ncbi:Acyltransferase [Aphelenchoides fujianensis]|nr:Acyltransferase [Aphelenchoides fujianensis]
MSVRRCPLTMAAASMRRLGELLAAITHISLWIILPLVSLWLPTYILFCTRFWPLIVLYAGWFVYDLRTPARGSRNWRWFKSSPLWNCHPHGILSIGSFAHLCTDGTNFGDHFPGLQPNILTLNGQFWFPFRREIGILLGGCESSALSLDFLLRSKTAGRIVGIVIGGAEEALDAHTGKNIVNLKCRRGFCKFALRYGASLVPSYSFGENDVFEQSGNDRGTKLRAIQRKIKKMFGFCPPLFHGVGLFNSKFGLLPRRHPITTVFGAPIQVPKIHHPSAEEVDALHQQYMTALIDLFNEHKTKHGLSPDAELTVL